MSEKKIDHPEERHWQQGPQVTFSLSSAKVLFDLLVELDSLGQCGQCDKYIDENGFCRFCTAMNFLQLSIWDAENAVEEQALDEQT